MCIELHIGLPAAFGYALITILISAI